MDSYNNIYKPLHCIVYVLDLFIKNIFINEKS